MTARKKIIEYRTITVCVDGCDNGELRGRVCTLRCPGGWAFFSLVQLLRMLEAAGEDDAPFTGPPEQRSGGPPAPEREKGLLATFSLRILFRQNATWQGYVTWQEGGVEQDFRSALELIFLMSSALGPLDRGA